MAGIISLLWPKLIPYRSKLVRLSLSITLSFVCLSVCSLYVCPSVCSSVRWSIYMYVSLSFLQSFCLFVRLFIFLSACLSADLFVCPSVCVYKCADVCLWQNTLFDCRRVNARIFKLKQVNVISLQMYLQVFFVFYFDWRVKVEKMSKGLRLVTERISGQIIDIKSLQNRLLKVCYVPATSTSLKRLHLLFFFFFGLQPLTVLMKQTRQAVHAIKQSILLRRLWVIYKNFQNKPTEYFRQQKQTNKHTHTSTHSHTHSLRHIIFCGAEQYI
jgi:hypothetical protein